MSREISAAYVAELASIGLEPDDIQSDDLQCETVPPNFSGVPPEARLEMLVGMLSELLAPAKTLVNELTLRANASTVTRNPQLENLIGSATYDLERCSTA